MGYLFAFLGGAAAAVAALTLAAWVLFRGMDADERNCDRDERGVV